MESTIRFLLENAVGHGSGVPTQQILNHLRENGLRISREAWQQEVLGPLRDHEIWIASTLGSPGMFIIETEADANAVYGAYHGRIQKEVQRLEVLKNQILASGWALADS